MNPLISIIIPVYNVEKYICECLDSVINQTYKNLQIIIVDDGSPDSCPQICDEYAENDNRITVIHKENGGVASARNAGLNVANGDLLYFMDSDDWIELNAMEKVICKIKETNADLIFFDYDHVQLNGKHLARKTIRYDNEKVFFDNMNDLETFKCYYCNYGVIWNYVVKSNLVLGKTNFREDVFYTDDSVFKFECYALINSFAYIKETLYHYRIVKSSYTQSYNSYVSDMNYNHYKAQIELLSKYNYPKDTILILNALFISALRDISDSIFDKRNDLNCYIRIKKLKEIISSDSMQSAFNNYDKSSLRPAAKLFMILKKPYWLTVYFSAKLHNFLIFFKNRFLLLKNKKEG